MPKSLNDILKGVNKSTIKGLTTGDNPGVDYADKMKDTRDFLLKHTVQKHDDRTGNGDDVFDASKVNKAKMERHGHEPKPKDIKVYNKTQQIGDPENKLKEAKDESEYGNEGEMAITQLKTICRHGEHLIKMLKPDTDLPEWVQSKITKAEDYISTAHDYLMSEMNEETINEAKLTPEHKSSIERKVKSKYMGVSGNVSFHKEDGRHTVKFSGGGKEYVHAINFDKTKKPSVEPRPFLTMDEESSCGTPSDNEPRFNGKDKPGKRKLLTDKKLQEMSTSKNQAIAARIALKHKREGTMPPKGTASHSMMGMSEKQLKDYTEVEPGAPKKVEEAVYNHSSSKTGSEKAREHILKKMEDKEKMKAKMEQAAPVETPISLPVYNSREGFDRI
jgi:hypothetical protein